MWKNQRIWSHRKIFRQINLLATSLLLSKLVAFKKFLSKKRHSDTVWKYHDFSITQILREINFGDSRSENSAILTHLETLNFDFLTFLQLCKAEIYQINQFRAPKIAKRSVLDF